MSKLYITLQLENCTSMMPLVCIHAYKLKLLLCKVFSNSVINNARRVFVTDIVQKLVFEDEDGKIISETDGSLVGKIIEVRFKSLH
jgi:hypothetical protein